MRALSLIRSTPVRLVVRAQTVTAGGSRPADAGMTTAEYAVGTVAACGFGGVLVEVLKSESVQSTIKKIVLGALNLAGIG